MSDAEFFPLPDEGADTRATESGGVRGHLNGIPESQQEHGLVFGPHVIRVIARMGGVTQDGRTYGARHAASQAELRDDAS